MSAPLSAKNSVRLHSALLAKRALAEQKRAEAAAEDADADSVQDIMFEIAQAMDNVATKEGIFNGMAAQLRDSYAEGGNLDILVANILRVPPPMWDEAMKIFVTAEAAKAVLPELLQRLEQEVCAEARRHLSTLKQQNQKLLKGMSIAEIRRIAEQPSAPVTLPEDMHLAATIAAKGAHFVTPKNPKRKKATA